MIVIIMIVNWLEFSLMVALGVIVFAAGRRLSSTRLWCFLSVVGLIGLYISVLSNLWPATVIRMGWADQLFGLTESLCVLMGISLLMGVLSAKVVGARPVRLLGLFAIVVWLQFGFLPFLLPKLQEETHYALATVIDKDGVCLQSTGYTCGPASAVSALGACGIEAHEGELAVLMKTTANRGTSFSALKNTLSHTYRNRNIRVSYMAFDDVGDMEGKIVLLPVDTLPGVGHLVALLKVENNECWVADPLSGLNKWSLKKMERVWRHAGIVVEKVPSSGS